MSFFPLTLDQVQQLEALNKPNLCFCACSHPDHDFTVGETDLDAPEFSQHKELLESFNIPLVVE